MQAANESGMTEDNGACVAPAAKDLQPLAIEEDLQLEGGLCEGEVRVHPAALRNAVGIPQALLLCAGRQSHCAARHSARQHACRLSAALVPGTSLQARISPPEGMMLTQMHARAARVLPAPAVVARRPAQASWEGRGAAAREGRMGVPHTSMPLPNRCAARPSRVLLGAVVLAAVQHLHACRPVRMRLSTQAHPPRCRR